MVVMSVLAWTKSDVVWNDVDRAAAPTSSPSITQLLTAIGIGWGISWFTYSSDYTRFVARRYTDRQVFWATALGDVPPDRLARGARRVDRVGGHRDAIPSQLVASVFGVMTIPVLLLIMHGPDRHQHPQPLLVLARRAVDRPARRRAGRSPRSPAVVGSGVLVAFIQSDSFATSFDNWIVSIIVWISPWAGITLVEYFVLRRGQGRRPGALRAARALAVRRRQLARDRRARARPGGRLGVGVRPRRPAAGADRQGRSATRTSPGRPACSSPAGLYCAAGARPRPAPRPCAAGRPVSTSTRIDVPAREGRGRPRRRRAALPRDRRRGRPGRRHFRLPRRRRLRVPLGRAHARAREPAVPAAGRALRHQPPAPDPAARGGRTPGHPRHARAPPAIPSATPASGSKAGTPPARRTSSGRWPSSGTRRSRSRSRSTCS